MLRSAKSLEGYELHARDGTIGRVKDVYFDDAQWRVRYLVVATGSWLTGRTVLIASAALTSREWDKRALAVDLTKEQVRESPAIDADRPVSRQQEADLHRYYAWPYYWTAPMLSVGYIAPVPPTTAPSATAARASNYPDKPEAGEARHERAAAADSRQTSEGGDPHLRSVRAIRGYHIEAADGSIGHVADFLIDDDTWDVRYLLVDTRNWLPGKKVIVSPARIRDMDWLSSTVRIDLTRDAVASGPEFDESRPVSADYIDRLEAHYGRPRGTG